MIAFPNAKINLGLNITAKRADGYHNLSSVFLPVDWKDALEIIAADTFTFTSTGLDIPGDFRSNLCVKAYELLKQNHDIGPVHMHLHKVIPMGAGLGGGSSDGAFALKLLNAQFALGLTNEQLKAYAKSLGADCPFFIDNRPQWVTGIGEIMEDIAIDLADYHLVIVFPGIHVPTREAFEGIVPGEPDYDLKAALRRPVSDWQQTVVNDFEPNVFAAHPRVGQIKTDLLAQGAQYATMTGTGSAVYGLFTSHSLPDTIQVAFPGMEVFVSRLSQ